MHCTSMYVKPEMKEREIEEHTGTAQGMRLMRYVADLPDFRALDEARCVGQAETGHEKALFAFREAGGERLLGR